MAIFRHASLGLFRPARGVLRTSYDPPAPPVYPNVELRLTPSSATEGTDSALVFTVRLDVSTDKDVTVEYATSDGTATAGTHYTSTSGTATIPAGLLSADISVPILDPSGYHGNTQFSVTLSNALYDGSHALTITTASKTGLIVDDEAPPATPPTVSLDAPTSATEGTSHVVFTARLDGIGEHDVTVDYATSNGTALAGTNYTAKTGTLTIPAGDVTGTITVTVLDPSGYHGTTQFTMTLSNASYNGSSITITTASRTGTILDNESNPSGGPNDYFDELVARLDLYKAYSLRPQAGQAIGTPHYANQLLNSTNLGYAVGSSTLYYVTYDPDNDTNPQRQDAAKINMPVFTDMGQVPGGVTGALSANIDASTTTIPVSNLTSTYAKNRSLLIDSELMTITASPNVAGGTLTVSRGQFGTTAAAHTSGAVVYLGNNSLARQVRLPLGTSDGHTYLFTWDHYWTDSYVGCGLTTYKQFQFSNRSSGTQWIEIKSEFAAGAAGFNPAVHVCECNLRSYCTPPYVRGTSTLKAGASAEWQSFATTTPLLFHGLTHNGYLIDYDNPPPGRLQDFIQSPGKWIRHWVRVEQRANDFDYVDWWVADEDQDAVLLYDQIPFNLRDPENTIVDFWIEFNTSTEQFTGTSLADAMEPRVSYIKNFVALIDPPSDISSLLVKPLGA